MVIQNACACWLEMLTFKVQSTFKMGMDSKYNLHRFSFRNILNAFADVMLCFVRTPLMLSVLSGHTDCVYSLLNKGANVEAKDKWGRTALHRGVRTTFWPRTHWHILCIGGGAIYYFPLIYDYPLFSGCRRWPATRNLWRPCFSTVPVSWCETVKDAHRSTWQQRVDTLGYWEACCMLPNLWKHSQF